MRHARRLTVILAVVAVSGGAALGVQAQERAGQARGLRYLSWDGRASPTAPASPETSQPDRGDVRRSNRVIPHGGRPDAGPAVPAPSASTGGARRTLTPANAWLRATPSPEASAPPPPPVAATAPTGTPQYLPDQGGRGQPAPVEVALAQPSSSPTTASAQPVDPMAPRRDAPIFRMQPTNAPPPVASPSDNASATGQPPRTDAPRRTAVVAANPDDRPQPQGARYYSVHRQNGREPDAVTVPEPTYIDALAITVAETPASQDLAQPDRGPTLIRDAQGRVRAQPAAPEGDYE